LYLQKYDKKYELLNFLTTNDTKRLKPELHCPIVPLIKERETKE
jgi:hypothetical protein